MSLRYQGKKNPAEGQRKTPVGKLVAAALAVLLLIAGSVWGVRESMESRRAAANLADVEQFRGQMRSDEFKEMTPEQRREFFQQFREKWGKLTFDQKKKLMQERSAEGRKRHDEYFALSQERARKAQEMDERQQRRGRDGKSDSSRRGNAASGSGGIGSQSSDAPPSDQDLKNREQRRRERIDMTTPDDRAQRSNMRQDRRMQQQAAAGAR